MTRSAVLKIASFVFSLFLAGAAIAATEGAVGGGASGGAASKARAIDGDTLEFGGEIIDLIGIDAPELGQVCLNGKQPYRCGVDAAYALDKLIGVGGVQCTRQTAGSAHVAGTCSSEKRDVGEILLQQGMATAIPDHFPGYADAEATARQAKLGIWRGSFVTPTDWRNGERLPEEVAADDQGTCDVKGVLDAGGQRIYLVPLDPGYADIRVDPTRGDRLFCSDEEARIAGWARAGEVASR